MLFNLNNPHCNQTIQSEKQILKEAAACFRAFQVIEPLIHL